MLGSKLSDPHYTALTDSNIWWLNFTSFCIKSTNLFAREWLCLTGSGNVSDGF